MTFDWTDYLKLADRLLHRPRVPGPEEAALRSAISRAYYAAFCSARNFAEVRDNFKPRGTADDHGLVINHFGGSSDQTRRNISDQLRRLRARRNMADYENTLSRKALPLARSSVALAQEVLKALNSL